MPGATLWFALVCLLVTIAALSRAEPADDVVYRQDRQTDNTTTAPPATTKAPSPPSPKPKSKGISLGRQAIIAFAVLAGLCLLVFLHNWCMSQSSEEFRKNVQNDLDQPDDEKPSCWECCDDTPEP